jgi:alpha-ketoglutarate-dependent taurine dioxygenase
VNFRANRTTPRSSDKDLGVEEKMSDNTLEQPVRRFAFAYGTLAEHAESGEERFQVEWREDDSVWYDILAFSRPNQLFSRTA